MSKRAENCVIKKRKIVIVCKQILPNLFSLLTVHLEGYCHTWSHTLDITLWTRDRLVAEVSICKTHIINKRRTFTRSAEFEPAFPASERLQTHARPPGLGQPMYLSSVIGILSFFKMHKSTLICLRKPTVKPRG